MSAQPDERLARPAPEVHITDIVLPGQTNNHGTMFGGEVMAMVITLSANEP